MKSEIKTILILVLSGLLLTAAFPKLSQDRLAWMALVPLLWALNDAGPREAFRRGLVFGIAHFLSLLYWLVPTMVIYGHLPVVLSVSILFLFASVLSLLFIAPMTCGLALAGRTPLRVLLVFPVFWVGFEYLRSFLYTGFPWELLGYSQHSRLQLIQISDIVGVYGVSGLIALANAALFLASLVVCRKTWRGRPVSGRMAIGGLAAAAVLVGLTWAYGELRIREIDRLASAAPTRLHQIRTVSQIPFEMEIPIQEVQHILHRKQIITLYEEGLKKAEIARRLGITERVVKYAIKRHLTGR